MASEHGDATDQDVNVFDGARQFAHRWDYFRSRPAPSARGVLRNRLANRSATGNINRDGTQGSSLSTMILPFQDGFWDVIEPGVRDLVQLFAFELDLVTYTSCEGHHYADRNAGDERRIGVLPRSPAEAGAILSHLREAAAQYATGSADGVLIEVVNGELLDRGARLPVIDLYFTRPRAWSWDAYFAAINAATARFVSQLRPA